MGSAPLTASETIPRGAAEGTHAATLQRLAILYARIALGGAFLSAIADRFGFWGKYGGLGNIANFTHYVAQVNSFMPAWYRQGFCVNLKKGFLSQELFRCEMTP